MFPGGGPPGVRYPRPYAPHCRIPTPFDRPQGPSMATGFGPQIGPVSYNLPTPRVPFGPFAPRQYESNQRAFPPFYHGNSEECRPSLTGPSYPSPGPGNNQGPCGGPPGENIGGKLNSSLLCAGFPDSRKLNPLSQEDIENERAGEEFLRCLATKEKFPVRDRAVDRGDPHHRPPCPGNGQRQDLSAEDQVCKRQSLGRSKSRPRSRSRSPGRSMGRSKSRPRSRSRSRSRGKSLGRSKSRPRSRSRSRGKSMGRSKSRPRSRSRSRGKSMGRSKSRPRSRSRSRGKSMGRSKSRPRSRSPSRGKSLGKVCSQEAGRGPSRSCSGSSTSSSLTVEGSCRTAPPTKKMAIDVFRELLLAGQLKEREELLTASKMAALKKQLDAAGHGQASAQTSQPPVNMLREHQSSSLTRETQSLLGAVSRGMEPSLLASIQGQMREQPQDLNRGQRAEIFGSALKETQEESVGEFLLPHERVSHDSSGFSRILGVMGNLSDLQQRKKLFSDIEDEEKFLYGDEDDKGKVSVKAAVGEKQAVVDFDKIKKALTTIGLDLGKAEISKMMARTQEHQTSRLSESPHHKGASPSAGLSPSQSHCLKRNRSPNSDIYSNSHSSTKQALYSGAPTGSVRSEFDISSQEIQAREIPFFRPDAVHQPLMTTDMQTTSLGSEAPILGQTRLKMADYWPQKSNLPAPHAPAIDQQILRLGPLKQVLESVKVATKGASLDTLVDLANQNAHGRTSQRQQNSEENAKAKEEALKKDMQEKMKRKDYLLKELESLLKQEVSEFVVPVIGFCCQLCEEFFGDITSAQDHAACQSHKEKYKKHARGLCKSGGKPLNRPTVDTERRDLRESEHKWTSKEESKGHRGIGEQVLVKEETLDTTRLGRVVSGPSPAVPSKMAERKETNSARSFVTDREEDASSKAHKKKKKKKEKKRLKKEKKEKKKEKKQKLDRA